MTQNKQLANRLSEVLLNGKWVTGSNIKDEIKDLDWKIATKKIDTLNTIADLVFHMDYYIAGLLNVMEGGQLEIKDKYSFEHSPITSSEHWKDLVNKFCTDSIRFVKNVESMSENDLLQPFVDKKYGNYQRNINVIIEHSYYHFGQIKLIKKLIDKK